MTSTTLFSDVVLPAATWYEKHDLNTTDMHPFVNSFNPAIAPPWQTRTDFDAFATIGRAFSTLAARHLGVCTDVVAVPLAHDTPDEMANPHGRVRDWKAGDCEPIPGATMPKLVVVERDYGAVAEKMGALGPLLDTLGATTKGVTFEVDTQIDYLRHKNGTVHGGVADGRPSLARDVHACEAILALSGTTNGHLATGPWVPGAGDADRPAPGRPCRGARRQAGHVRRHPGRADLGHHLAGVVRQRERRPEVLPVHHQRRTPEALAHAHRAPALLPRPRLDGRTRGEPSGLPAAAEHAGAVRRTADRRQRRAGYHGAVPDPAQQVVHPLGVPGQPAHAQPVPWRPDDLDC